jgi:hypothetical protein
MAGMLPKQNFAVEPACLCKGHEWLFVLLGSILVDADHLTAPTGTQHLKVLLANLQEYRHVSSMYGCS